jgi:hypothetical protein
VIEHARHAAPPTQSMLAARRTELRSWGGDIVAGTGSAIALDEGTR